MAIHFPPHLQSTFPARSNRQDGGASSRGPRDSSVLPLLDVHQNHRVLEIGFGPGADVRRVSEMALRGFVANVCALGVK